MAMLTEFWKGFLLFPALILAIIALIALAARFSRGIIQWYIGLPITRWWAMGFVVFGLKHTPQKRIKTIRAQGRIWISPMVKAFEDKEAIL